METPVTARPESFEIPVADLVAHPCTPPSKPFHERLSKKNEFSPDLFQERGERAVERKALKTANLAAHHAHLAQRALVLSRANATIAQLAQAEKLQAILSKLRHADVKRKEAVEMKMGRVRAHNAGVGVRREAGKEEGLTPGKLEIDAALESAAIRAKQALDARMTPLKAHLAKVEQRKMIARTRRQDSMATLPGVSDKLAEIEAEAVVGTASE